MSAYFDHAATSPVRREVMEAMLPYFGEAFGNPTGAHAVGRRARQAVDESRDTIASYLDCEPGEIIFTSGGTESDNLAVLGCTSSGQGAVVCSAIEHPAVLRCVESLGGSICPVTSQGMVDLDALEELVSETTALVSVMLVNNETGIIQPLHKVARILERKAPHALLHTDAVQALPWLDVARLARRADLVTLSAHKVGGPQGVGALLARRRAKPVARAMGGGQERERRSGTHNVAGIAGFAAAVSSLAHERDVIAERIAGLRDRLVDGILETVPGAVETGDRGNKVPGNGHVCFEGVESEALLVLLDESGMYASAGSSCSSGAMEPSHVLLAMGMSRSLAMGSLRLSLGAATTEDEVDLALSVVPGAVERLRSSWVPA